jgi:pimeloyl-ACP methyl ester carboxylesterase
MNTTPIYKSPEGEREVMAIYETVLAHWPVPCETLRLPTRHGETFVIANGEKTAPPLVLLHGASSNATAWVGDVADYSRAFRVYAVDILGEAGKSAPNRPAWDGPAYAEWLEDVLDALKVRKTSLVGISQGGWTALKFATTRPERVEKLVLLTPGGVAPTKLSFLLRAIPLSMMGRRGAEAINRIVFGKQPIHPDAVKFMNVIMTHFKARMEAEQMFSDEALQRLTMPTLLLGGAQDALRSADQIAARLKKFAPDLTVITLPDMGHVLHNTTAQVLPFLTATGSPAA